MGGSPCSGKSSIAHILAREYGLQTYHCDDHYEAHLKRADPGKQPRISRASGVTWDEVWMHPVDYLVVREFAFYREEFEMIMEDLLAMPRSCPILAEGAALLPECVAPLLAKLNQAIWIVPTEHFQRTQYARRDWVENILRQCRQPSEAWENWMGRDAAFARQVSLDARERQLTVLEVDGRQSIQRNAEVVTCHFGLLP
jgi:2-phosphoglycerate kinase